MAVPGRKCTICEHPQRDDINVELVRRKTYREITGRFGLSDSALSRHRNEHLPDHVQKALAEYGKSEGLAVLSKLSGLVGELEALLKKAKAGKSGAEVRANVAELRKLLELAAKLQGDLMQEGTTSLHLSHEWVSLKAVLVAALEPHPEAYVAVVAALERSERVSHG